MGQVADGADAHVLQGFPRAFPNIEQGAHRKRIHNVPVIFPRDHRGRIGLFIVAAQLGKNLIEGNPNRNCQAGLPFDLGAQAVRDLRPGTEQPLAPGDVQPAFIDAEGLHQIRIALIDRVDPLGIYGILVTMRRGEHQVGAFAPRLPDGLRGLDAEPLGPLIFCQYDPVPVLGVPTDRHRHVPVRRMQQAFHRCVKCIAVTVQNHTVRALHTLISNQMFYLIIERCRTKIQ